MASPGRRSASCRSWCGGGTTGCAAHDNGVMDEPMLRIWMQDSVPPSTAYAERPGRWVGGGELAVPAGARRRAPARRPPHPRPATRRPADARAAHRVVAAVRGPVRGQVVPLQRPAGPALRPARGGRRLPGLRRRGRSPSGSRSWARRWWTSSSPSTGRWRSSRCGCPTSPPTAAPPGSATACCNLTHRDGHEQPEALVPGERYRVRRAAQRHGAGASRPATGCGWRSRRPTGRWPGPRPSRSR